jgi:hypothetical protein
MPRFARHRRARWRRPTPSGDLLPAIGRGRRGPADEVQESDDAEGSRATEPEPRGPSAEAGAPGPAGGSDRPKVRLLRTEAELQEARARAAAQLARITEAMGPAARERLGASGRQAEAEPASWS